MCVSTQTVILASSRTYRVKLFSEPLTLSNRNYRFTKKKCCCRYKIVTLYF